MRVIPVGRRALLLELADTDAAQAWRAELERRRAAGELVADEVVPGERTVLLDGVADPAAAAVRLLRWPPPTPVDPGAGPEVEVPTVFDGTDLPSVADHWRVAPAEVVARLTGVRLRVAFCGFAPGFGYLTGLPAEWAVPRLATPRPSVPAGSVALAGGYAGIYPTASPGGWRLVGRTSLSLFDVHRDPPARLAPGTRVRLVRA